MNRLVPSATPDWKKIILASPDWPENLVIPQNDTILEDSESIETFMSTGGHWMWELWRQPDGHCYYLQVWPVGEDDQERNDSLAAELSVMETFQFLLTNWMPRDVIADLIFERPDLVKSLDLPPSAPGLN